jgi:glycosyltransferase involved in cell wall biosynthesis
MRMSRHRKKLKRKSSAPRVAAAGRRASYQYRRACRLAQAGDHAQARRLYGQLLDTISKPARKALLRSDLAALAAANGDLAAAREGFRAALEIDPGCEPARANLMLLEAEAPCPQEAAVERSAPTMTIAAVALATPVRVAVVSFLFNWPSTGGGIVHTVELARFLAKAGYEVHHFYARYEPWGIGCVEGKLPFASLALDFDESSWNVLAIQERYRQAVDAFGPDYVILTDSWNMKPLLAEAVAPYPYFLRLQAMECLCPLNNVRLLPQEGGRFGQCQLHQSGHPAACADCLTRNGHFSGGLHRAERALACVGSPEYHAKLLRALREAEAVLVVNPLTETLVRPYARQVQVVTAGMDPARFPWPWPDDPALKRDQGKQILFFAGLVEELMKGFHVLQEACALLWQKRQDFEVVATADPPGRVNDFTRYVGWLSQEELPRHLRAADVLVMPTVAQEALGRTAVEAMAAGRPVVASRLGGLPWTVLDGVTGLLCEPGDPADLVRKMEMLLDDPGLRERMGLAGRKRFEEHYAWPVIIERHYRPLLAPRLGRLLQGGRRS